MTDFKQMSAKERLSSCLGYILGFLILAAAASYFTNKDKEAWTGIFYPETGMTTSAVYKTGFKSLQTCRDWAEEQADELDLSTGTWDYDCGTGCVRGQSPYGRTNVDYYDCESLSK